MVTLVDALALSSVRQRIARLLLDILDAHGGNPILLPGSQSHVITVTEAAPYKSYHSRSRRHGQFAPSM